MLNWGESRKVRWWPLWLVWIAGLLAVVVGWLLNPEASRQAGVMRTLGIAIACLSLSIVWLAALSRLPWKVRFQAAGVLALLFAAMALFSRYEGVSGDLVPIFKWRWSGAPAVEQRGIEEARLWQTAHDKVFDQVFAHAF